MSDVALVLAAGMGTRMRSNLAKVLHPVLGRPMVRHAVLAAQGAGMSVRVVVNHQEDAVRAALADDGVGFSRQPVPRGTGDAVRSALADLPATGTLVVMPGDAPLLRAETLSALLAAHQGQLCTVLAVTLDDPAAYGRIVRDQGPVRIVEAAELSEDEKARYTEINSGVYAFDLALLHQVVPDLQPHPPKGEIYLTDVLQLAAERCLARVLVWGDAGEVMGVNDRWALAQAEAVLGERLKRAHAVAGVTFQEPHTTRVECDVVLGQDVVIGPGCVLGNGTVLGDNVTVGANCVLARCTVAHDVLIRPMTVIEDATVATGCAIGPLARLRPGAQLGEGVRIGNFVEIKNAVLEHHATVGHLSYVGDARIGAGTNLGAGTITCNYDGVSKHRTDIGAGAFIGSNTALVAPVSVGDQAIVGAGSVVTDDVPAGALALGRARQVSKPNLGRRIRARLVAQKDLLAQKDPS